MTQESNDYANDKDDCMKLLKVLSPAQVIYIDKLLDELGAFGEVRLIKRGGKVRFIQKVESMDFISSK